MSPKRIVKHATAVSLALFILASSAMAAPPRARKAPDRPSRRATNARTTQAKNASLVLAKATKAAAFDDCDVCHDNCLAGSLTCIAISAIAACAPCAGVCLAAQAVCHINCNRTRACKVGLEEPPAN